MEEGVVEERKGGENEEGKEGERLEDEGEEGEGEGGDVMDVDEVFDNGLHRLMRARTRGR